MRRNFYSYLVAMLTIVLSGIVLLASSQNLTYSESFESGFTIGSTIGSNADWYDGGNGPVITSGNGLAGSVGLSAATNIFSWTAHPFNWNDADFLGVILEMDFETDGSGHFDDDRIGWSLYDNGVSSNEIFSVQLDPGGSGYNIEGYWLNASNTKVYPSMVSLPTLPGNTWYRFHAEITKLTATSASIEVSLTELDGSGNPTGTPITGSIANTADLGSDAPNAKYFPSGNVWANYKNYTSAAAPADNAYLEIVKAATGPSITIIGTPLNPFTSITGSPSAEQSYSVSGSSLTEDITITAPADFEISITSGSGFGSTVILTESGGTVSTTPIYVRFNRSTSGTSTGDITHTSAGVTTENVAVSGTASPSIPVGSVRFAAFGDFGDPNANGGVTEQAVADLTISKSPDLIITLGDNNYLNNSSTATWDATNGDFYYPYIKYPAGSTSSHASNGVTENAYFPAFGNHDWDAGGETQYFDLPGNERYYTFTEGPVQFFCIDSDTREPDGTSSSSTQGQWLQTQLAASTAAWKIVYDHHPPFSSSSSHGSTPYMQWPFEDWGADAVLSGHDHLYERIIRDENADGKDIAYIINGAGGKSLYSFGTPVAGSEVRIGNDGTLNNYGTLIVDASSESITFEFWTIQNGGTLRDSYSITKPSEIICESFDDFTVGQTVGADEEWFDSGAGPVVGATDGVNGSQGLGASGTIFTWIAHPFDWTASDFEAVNLRIDFETDANGDFDDDRAGWMISDISSSSDFIFGIQLDNANSHLRMEGYWDHVQGDDAGRVEMADLDAAPIDANAWYQLRAEITKLGATSAQLHGELWSLDGTGTPVSLIASGDIANTDLVGATLTPNVEYFTGPIWPAYKNHTGAAAPADNVCFEVITGISTTPTISLTGIPLEPFTSEPGVNSAEQSYTVTGTNLTTGITVTAPADFKVSATSGGPYSSSIVLDASGGDVFVIFNRTTNGTSTGDITHTSTGADQVNIPVTGTVAYPTLTFQEGVDGYSGTVDTYLSEAEPALSHGTEESFLWDADDPSGSGQYLYSLVRFDNIFGTDAGQIPIGSVIQSATLTYTIFNEGNEADVNEVAIDWTTDEIWNGFGTTAGIQPEDYGNSLGSTSGSIPVGTKQLDVTSSLSAWSLSPADNHGWIFRPTGTNGVDVRSSEYTTSGERPLLTVEYIPPAGPAIYTSVTSLAPFTSEIGLPSAEQSYTVLGADLTEDITVTAPADFEISTTSGSGFTHTITLPQTGGVVPVTPVYIRFNRTTAGTSSGNVSHTSTGATTRNVAVTGIASGPSMTNWKAYNDCVYRSSDQYIGTNVTQFGIGSGFTGSTTGALINQADGGSTGATVTLTQSGGVVWQPDPANGGSDCSAGTDARNEFGGIADMTGVVYYGPAPGWYVDVTFTGLDPAKNYTFVTSTNRGNPSYTDRPTIYSIMNADTYTNESSSGVTVIDESSVYFNTGDNTDNGYVAKWTNITATDGSFTVRATHHPSANSGYKAYAFDVFMLEESEPSTAPLINITGDPMDMFYTIPGTPSAEQSYVVSGINLEEDIAITAPAEFEISTTSGSGFSASLALTPTDGIVDATSVYVRFNPASEGEFSGIISHSSLDATTKTVDVTGVAGIPADPTDLTTEVISYQQIDLTWTDNADNETGYEVERSLVQTGPFSLVATLPANTESFSNSGLDPDTEYCFQVRAISPNGNSDYSNSACATAIC